VQRDISGRELANVLLQVNIDLRKPEAKGEN
jgi:hypothetical protein